MLIIKLKLLIAQVKSINMERGKIAEGKTKVVFSLDGNKVLLKFKDDITAGDGLKRDIMRDKGKINARTSAILFRFLESKGIETHYIDMHSEDTLVVKRLKMIPIEIVARKIATGSIVKRLPIKEGELFDPPIVEFFLKDDQRHDPLLNDYHIKYFKLMSDDEIKYAEEVVTKVINELYNYLEPKGLILYDLKIEMGRDKDGRLIVGDELTLDSMRVREKGTGRILDKDLYRRGEDLEKVRSAYIEFLNRISGD